MIEVSDILHHLPETKNFQFLKVLETAAEVLMMVAGRVAKHPDQNQMLTVDQMLQQMRNQHAVASEFMPPGVRIGPPRDQVEAVFAKAYDYLNELYQSYEAFKSGSWDSIDEPTTTTSEDHPGPSQPGAGSDGGHDSPPAA